MSKLPKVSKGAFGSFDTFGSRISGGEVPEADPAEAAEREAIQAEPELSQAGTPERERHDRQHRAAMAGLLRTAALSRAPVGRPVDSIRILDPQCRT